MLSNKIKELRKEKGYTFAKLSELSGISTGRLSDLATGKRNNPTMDTLIKSADALGVLLDELVGRNNRWNLTQGICLAGAWMIENHNESTMVADMLASMHITKEMMQQKHIAEEDYKILSKAMDSNWKRRNK
jgi:putative phage regulatory protein